MLVISKYTAKKEKNYFTSIFSFVYRSHITQNDKEKKIRAELLLCVVYTIFRR